jgi:hypothetical protein
MLDCDFPRPGGELDRALSGRSALKVVAVGSKSSARPDVLFGSNVNAFHDTIKGYDFYQ